MKYNAQHGRELMGCKSPVGEPKSLRVIITPSRLGFIDRDCHFSSLVFEGSINTSVVVAAIDDYSKKIEKPTTLVIDNTPTHTSNGFNENIELWKERGLMIYRTPPYSPELNIIEIVWRKIRYE